MNLLNVDNTVSVTARMRNVTLSVSVEVEGSVTEKEKREILSDVGIASHNAFLDLARQLNNILKGGKSNE